MSPRSKVTRDQWELATLRLIAQGHVPLDVPLVEQCARLGVTKGSFYSHFPGGEDEMHRAVIARWLDEAGLEALATTVGAVQGPLDRLRLLRARAHDRAGLDGTMRQWAQRDSAAAAAVTKADSAVTAEIGQALEDLGYPPDEAWALSPLVTHAVASAGMSPAGFETLLGVLLRAAPADARVEMVHGPDPDRKIFFALMENLPAEAVAELRARAEEFADQHDGPPPRTGPRSARTAQSAGA